MCLLEPGPHGRVRVVVVLELWQLGHVLEGLQQTQTSTCWQDDKGSWSEPDRSKLEADENALLVAYLRPVGRRVFG